VFDKDGATVSVTGGDIADGEFTATDRDDDLFVSFSVNSITNGLDIISFVLEKYENIEFNSFNYDVTEWNAEKIDVKDSSIFAAKGKLKTSVQIIEQICIDNNGVFDVLSDGRFTFRRYDPDRVAAAEIFLDETMSDPKIDYPTKEYLSSVKINHSLNIQNNTYQVYTNLFFQAEVYGRYRQYQEKSFNTALSNIEDASEVSETIMDLSKFIFPNINLSTKTQNVFLRILDNLIYTYQRRGGKIIIERSSWQLLEIDLNLSSFLVNLKFKHIKVL